MYATVRRYEGDRASPSHVAESIPDERLEGSGSAAALAFFDRMTFMHARAYLYLPVGQARKPPRLFALPLRLSHLA